MYIPVMQMPECRRISVAIDGPAGAGKTTIAREVARRLGCKYVDTGAMYRAVAWKSIELGIPLSDEDAIVEAAGKILIDFAEGDGSRIYVDVVDVSEAIRTPEVTKLSSPVSAISGVRKCLVEQQRRLAGDGGVVMEGRDIGSVVLPDAEVKVFLTASVDERARRRYAEMRAAGQDVDLEALKHDIEERDRRDSTRADSPLVKVSDAHAVNTDGLSIEEVVDRVMELCRRAGK
jgi:cytidylate kinase